MALQATKEPTRVREASAEMRVNTAAGMVQRWVARVPPRLLLLVCDDANEIAQRCADTLAEALAVLGTRIEKRQVSSRATLPLAAHAGPSVVTAPFSVSTTGPSLRDLRRSLQRDGFQLVHTVGTRSALFARLAAAAVRPRPVVICQDYLPSRLSGLTYWADRWTCNWADAYLVPTFEQRAQLLHAGLAPERVRVLPYAVPAFWRETVPGHTARDHFQLSPHTPCFWVGLGTNKGTLEFWVELSAELDHAGYPHASLLARHPHSSYTAEICIEELRARFGIRGAVRWVDPAEHALALKAADLVVVPPHDGSSLWHALLLQLSQRPVLCSSALVENLPPGFHRDPFLVVPDSSPTHWAQRAATILAQAPSPRSAFLPCVEEILPDYLQTYWQSYRRKIQRLLR